MSLTNRSYSKTLTRNMIAGAGSAMLGGALTFISYPVYLKYLGYADYGLWMILSTLVTLCQIGSLGIAPAVSKLIAEESGRTNRAGAQHYVEAAILTVTMLGLVMVLILFLSRNLILQHIPLTPRTAHLVEVLLPAVLLLSFYAFLTDVFGAVLMGLGRMDLSSVIQTGGQFVAFGCSVILLKRGQGVMALAAGSIVSLIAVHILTTVCVWHVGRLKLLPGLRLDWTRARTLFRLASVVFGASAAAAFFFPLNKLLLSSYVGLAAVPVYELACTTSMRLRAFFEMALRPIMPALSHAVTFDPGALKSELRQVNRKASRVLLTAGVVFGSVIILANSILDVWLRKSSHQAMAGPLRIMLVGAFLSLLGVPAYYALLGLGRASVLFWSHIVQSAANIAVVVAGHWLGYSLSLTVLLAASSAAMGLSTCFLVVRYRGALRELLACPATSSAQRELTVLAAMPPIS
jgi:O-antigen/teichoic acid export membrane protein